MSVDYDYRRKQLALITQTIAQAMIMTRRHHGGDDGHITAHYFEQFLGNRSVSMYLDDIDNVLVPNLQTSPAWTLLIPEILQTIYPLRTFDTAPRYGCPNCRW